MERELFIIGNAFILAGYVTAGIRVAPNLPGRLATKITAVCFFVTCGLTHLEQILHLASEDQRTFYEIAADQHMVWLHIIQGIAICTFLALFLRDLRTLEAHLTALKALAARNVSTR